MTELQHHVRDVYISLDQEPEAKENQIKELCITTLTGWSGLNPSSLELCSISGGISNMLVKVTPPSGLGLNPVAVKVFGNKTELLIDREGELKALIKLNQAGFGPQVLAVFSNGRIEEFLLAKTLTPEEVAQPACSARIAAILRRLHALQVDMGGPCPPGESTLFHVVRGWLAMARQLQFTDEAKAAKYKQLDFPAMSREVDELEALCKASASPVVFCHNDLLAGNILVLLGGEGHAQQGAAAAAAAAGGSDGIEGPIQLIDFEYSAYSYRGFDFGNHFNEWAGFECDYSRYPAPEQQRLFFRHYLAASECGSSGGCSSGSRPASCAPAASEPSDALLERMCAEADLFSLASHVYWGIWAIVQARYSPIDFDYLDYSELRWAEYRRCKPARVEQARRVFGLLQ